MTSIEVPRHPRAAGLLLGGILTGVLLATGSFGLWALLDGPEQLHTESQQQTYHQPLTDIDIAIGLVDSSVTLISGKPGAVKVWRQVTWSRAKPVPEEQVVGRTLQIRARCPHVLLGSARQCRLGLVVEVPPGTAVRADVSAGRIDAEQLTGAVDLTTSNGDITVSDIRGRLRARSDDGNITGTGLNAAEVDVKTGWANVDLRFAVVPDLVQAVTGTGDVSIVVPHAGSGTNGYQIRADTKEGRHNVDVPQDSAGRHTITAHADYGDVTVRHPAST